MFDAKSILENIVRGAASSQPSGASGGGGFGDLINEIGKSLSEQPGGAPSGGQPPSSGTSGTSIGDILGDLARQFGQPASNGAPGSPSQAPAPASGSSPDLGDVLSQIKDKLNQAGGSISDGGSITDILGKIFTQATQGVSEGASRVGEATGASDALGRAAADPRAAEILNQLKGVLQSSPFAAGTAAGGLGGILLGTQAGRSLASSAVKIGALAMIGGLAYKALQNYQAGKPLITGATTPVAPPAGSGFEPAAVTNDAAVHYIQAMIAAAAADGRIDANEHETLVASLTQAGAGSEAEAFIAKELNSPRSVQELAASVASPQEAIQLYTAARIAVADKSPAEQQFLASLAAALNIDPKLAAHVDATAQAAA
ncbi:MAG: tellurite resistance TerB family protein [Hyphomicrobium sp.]|uniref:tellurite resistance TerB family protein n=1 Tax=Hyphomicrobium sp. TaxID=82 RepID=UPI00356332A4